MSTDLGTWAAADIVIRPAMEVPQDKRIISGLRSKIRGCVMKCALECSRMLVMMYKHHRNKNFRCNLHQNVFFRHFSTSAAMVLQARLAPVKDHARAA